MVLYVPVLIHEKLYGGFCLFSPLMPRHAVRDLRRITGGIWFAGGGGIS